MLHTIKEFEENRIKITTFLTANTYAYTIDIMIICNIKNSSNLLNFENA